MVLDKRFPPDIRIEKAARYLIKHGYEVHLLCVGDKIESELVDGIYVHRITFDRSTFLKKVYNANYLYNYFYIRKWCKELLKLHKKERFSIFHAHDLTTAPFL